MAALAATTLGSCATQKNHQKTDNSMNATKIESNLDEQYLVLSDAEQKAVAQTNDFAFNLSAPRRVWTRRFSRPSAWPTSWACWPMVPKAPRRPKS